MVWVNTQSDEGWKHGEVDEALLHATTFFIQNREIIVREFPQLGLVVTVLILLAYVGIIKTVNARS